MKRDHVALILVGTLALTGLPSLQAATYYWDTNGATAGSGAGTGTWDSGVSALWSTDTTGASATQTITTLVTDTVTFSAGSNGTAGVVTVSGSQSANVMNINQAGLTFSGGTIWLGGGTLNVNSSASINSAVNIGNIKFLTAGQAISFAGSGTLGNITANNAITGSTSTINLNSGTYALNGSSSLSIGRANASGTTGGININTGAVLNVGLAFIGNDANGGLVTVNGGVLNGTLLIGKSGTGRVILQSGTLINTGNYNPNGSAVGGITVGGQAGATGELDVQGGVVNTNYLNIGSSTGASVSGYVYLTGGTSNIGTLNFGSGYYTSSGTTATAGSGTLALAGGVLNVGSGGIINSGSGAFTCKIVLSGGTLGALNTAWSSALNMSLSNANGGATIRTSGTDNVARDITLSGTISGNGGLTKIGGGTLILQGMNTYTGQTLISSGTFKLDTMGTMNISLVALNGASAFAQGGSGVLLLNGTLDITDYTGASGSSWTIVDSSLITGNTYTGFTLTGFTNNGGGIWTDNLTGNYTFNQATGILSVVPEPSTYVLLIFGVVSMVILRRFSGKKSKLQV